MAGTFHPKPQPAEAMTHEYAPQAGIAQTVKLIVRNPRFANRFFKHLFDGRPEPAGDADAEPPTPATRAAELRTVLLAMIDHAAGAPGARHRLRELSARQTPEICAISADNRDHWLASLTVAVAELAPALPDEARSRIRSLYDTQLDYFIGLDGSSADPSA